jgi:catechol 2,3-dioxygenase-like lactoylglutathione lyase family enzyme
MTYQLHHIHLLCSNLGETVKFFSEILGAKFVDWRKFQNADGATLDLNGTNIYLRLTREGEKVAADSDQVQYGYNHIGLKVENLDRASSELNQKGVIFTQLPKDLGNRKVAFLKGPDNISIELIQFKG